jgi:hypothetical protein
MPIFFLRVRSHAGLRFADFQRGRASAFPRWRANRWRRKKVRTNSEAALANTSSSPGPSRHEQERLIGPLTLAQADGEVGAKSRAEIFLPITP